MDYLVIYEEGPRNWSAYLPDLPGCIATGKTRKSVEKNIKSAVAMHLAAMRRDGDPIPKPTTDAGRVVVSDDC